MKLRFLLSPLFLACATLMPGLIFAQGGTDSARITSLLQQAREHAANADHDAEMIQAYTRSKVSWESHAMRLESMKEHVNKLGKVAADLAAARPEGSPWQQQSIDDVDPLLRSMADHLTAMIQHLNDNQNRVHMPAFKDYANANYEYSQNLLRMIDDYVDYEQAKSKTEALEQKLQIGEPSASGEE